MTEALETHLRRQIEHSGHFFWHRLRWCLVRSYLPQRTAFELVDVGAGAGLAGTFLKRDRPLATYRFVEPIATLNQFLRGQYGDTADLGTATTFGSARVVLLLDVLEHQQDDRAFLQQLVDKLEPGTILLLTVPAMQNLWSQWDEALGHYRRYDKRSLCSVVSGLPLSMSELNFLFPEMVPLAMLRKRRTANKNVVGADEDVEFPDLPAIANEMLYRIGTASLGQRHRWKRGTSLFMAATVEG